MRDAMRVTTDLFQDFVGNQMRLYNPQRVYKTHTEIIKKTKSVYNTQRVYKNNRESIKQTKNLQNRLTHTDRDP